VPISLARDNSRAAACWGLSRPRYRSPATEPRRQLAFRSWGMRLQNPTFYSAQCTSAMKCFTPNQAALGVLALRLQGKTMSKALLTVAAAVTVALAGCAPPQSADCARALSQASKAQCQPRQQSETEQQQEDELWRATAIGGGSG
jgi:ribosomal protein L12E/L44/L45/RPP1/RPP2